MTASDPQTSISERYQQIQALTPTDDSADYSGQTSMPISTFLSLSLFIFFFVVIFLGFLPLVIERFRDFRRFQMSILLALVGSALPLTMGLLFQQSGLLTRAFVGEVPRNVAITAQPNSFQVSWETSSEQFGALRYGKEPKPEALNQTVLEVGGLQRTTEHEVYVDNLESGTNYYFLILSGASWYDQQGVLLHVTTLSR